VSFWIQPGKRDTKRSSRVLSGGSRSTTDRDTFEMSLLPRPQQLLRGHPHQQRHGAAAPPRRRSHWAALRQTLLSMPGTPTRR
jgi:hypothetical protein